MQANAAAKQKRAARPRNSCQRVSARGRNSKCLTLAAGRDPALAARLAQGDFRKARRISRGGAVCQFGFERAVLTSSPTSDRFPSQSTSLGMARSLPRRVRPAGFLAAKRHDSAYQRCAGISGDHEGAHRIEPGAGLWSLSFKDKLRVFRALALVQVQSQEAIKPYQQLRYWSNVPFRHGPVDVVKHSATPSRGNPASPLQKTQPERPEGRVDPPPDRGQQDERLRLRPPVPRCRQDDLLGQASETQNSGSKTPASSGMKRKRLSTRSGGSRCCRSRSWRRRPPMPRTST